MLLSNSQTMKMFKLTYYRFSSLMCLRTISLPVRPWASVLHDLVVPNSSIALLPTVVWRFDKPTEEEDLSAQLGIKNRPILPWCDHLGIGPNAGTKGGAIIGGGGPKM